MPCNDSTTLSGCLDLQLQELLVSTAALEREVAEMRQLYEEEEQLLLMSIESMAKTWQELQGCREAQGGACLTDLAFNVVQLHPYEDTLVQQVGVEEGQGLVRGQGAGAGQGQGRGRGRGRGGAGSCRRGVGGCTAGQGKKRSSDGHRPS
jgi:hypothetical protein